LTILHIEHLVGGSGRIAEWKPCGYSGLARYCCFTGNYDSAIMNRIILEIG